MRYSEIESIDDQDLNARGSSTGDRQRSIQYLSVLDDRDPQRGDHAAQDLAELLRDLNLDQVFAKMAAQSPDYDLMPFYYRQPLAIESIEYRHEVMRDLEEPANLQCVRMFVQRMRTMRETAARIDKMYDIRQKQRWFLHSVEAYCVAVQTLNDALSDLVLSSRGLSSLQAYVARYSKSDMFTSISTKSTELVTALADIRYALIIKGDGFTVRNYTGEIDYSAEVAATFEKFRQVDVKDYFSKFARSETMNHIETKVLEFIARLHPDIFATLDRFCVECKNFLDPVLARFDREVQFYLTYIDLIMPLKSAGLRFCYPLVSADDKTLHASTTFDLALAVKLVGTKTRIVTNDFDLSGRERIFIVSGPNQGGKTTFARTFGQLHYLAALGLPVPGRDARLFLCDAIFTHFEREELSRNLEGKLQDDLLRIRAILDAATPRSIVIMNEIFNSTTADDATSLARKILEQFVALDLLCVCVTFLDELVTVSDTTVSMVSTVMPDNPAERTYRIERRPADGESYAISIAKKYRLTDECLRARLARRQSLQTNRPAHGDSAGRSAKALS